MYTGKLHHIIFQYVSLLGLTSVQISTRQSGASRAPVSANSSNYVFKLYTTIKYIAGESKRKSKFFLIFLLNMIKKDEINVFGHLEPGLHINFKAFFF